MPRARHYVTKRDAKKHGLICCIHSNWVFWELKGFMRATLEGQVLQWLRSPTKPNLNYPKFFFHVIDYHFFFKERVRERHRERTLICSFTIQMHKKAILGQAKTQSQFFSWYLARSASLTHSDVRLGILTGILSAWLILCTFSISHTGDWISTSHMQTIPLFLAVFHRFSIPVIFILARFLIFKCADIFSCHFATNC